MVLDTPATRADVASELAALASRVRASVVEVRSARGQGAGTIWTHDGLIVTNDHVAPDDQARIVLADGQELNGAVVRRERGRDLVVLRVPASDLPAASIGDSASLRVGQLVFAVGNPLGVPRAITAGIISGPRVGEHGRLQWRDGVLAGIDLRPGNSGGPLVNAAGDVVAVNAMVIGPRLALSVPSAAVTALLASGGPRRLGIRVQVGSLPDAAAAVAGRASGLLVVAVDDDGAADRAGLLPGDLLVAAAVGPPGTSPAALLEPGDLARLLGRLAPDGVTVHLYRAGVPLELTIRPAA